MYQLFFLLIFLGLDKVVNKVHVIILMILIVVRVELFNKNFIYEFQV